MYDLKNRYNVISHELDTYVEQYNTMAREKQRIENMLKNLMTEVIKRQAILEELQPYLYITEKD